WRIFAPLELDPSLTAALAAFLEFGYHGATMRNIAQRAGLSVPGVYHYYASKQEMLVAILDVTMADLLGRTTAARAEGRDPVERFALIVECLALYHTHRRELGFVGASEMRSLVPAQRTRVAAARRAQQRMVDEEVDGACRDGLFAVPRPHEASRAVVTMCTALPQWFDGQGPATAEEVAAQYVEFALDLMRCTPKGRRRRTSMRRSMTPRLETP
ncbi:MAG: TetR/AcrR family transcriptional regulator, partial [Actinomycetota bacterium]|nr:TetR/AcrR family transcriptional regulator [Actinomycetota bacterium]